MEELDIAVITRRTIQSILALISRGFILSFISLATFVIVSTTLTPAEFGTYIIVMTMQEIISFFTNFGLGAALVQKKEALEQEEIATVFTVQFLLTLGIFLLVFAFRDAAGDLVSVFTSSQLTDDGLWLLIALTFTIFLSAFKLIPSVQLERTINFQKLIIPQIGEALVFNVILVVLLLRGFGISSYTYAFVVSSLIGIPLYYLVSPWRVRFGITKRSLSHLKFGTQFQAKNILANIKDKFLKLFLGATLGEVKVGYIGFAEKWAYFAYGFIVNNITTVTFSTYSRLQSEKDHLQKTLEKSLFFVSLVMFPVLTVVMLGIPYLIQFYTRWNKWEPAVVSLLFLSMNAAISSLSGILVNALDANGKVKLTLRLMVLWTVLTWVLTIFLMKFFDYNGVAIASFLVTLTIVYTVYLVKQVVHFNFFSSVWKPFIASIIMGVFMLFLAQWIATNVVILVFVILMGGAVYLSVLYLLAGKEIIADIKKIVVKQ